MRGFEDAVESIYYALLQENLMTDDIKKLLERILTAAKENKINKLMQELGLF